MMEPSTPPPATDFIDSSPPPRSSPRIGSHSVPLIPAAEIEERQQVRVRRYAFQFDTLGGFQVKEWDLTLDERPDTFSWYHMELSRACPSLAAGAKAMIDYMYPTVSLSDITTLVSNGPFCGTAGGALLFRINSAGPMESPFTLRLAVRVTEQRIISVSLGRVPRLEFARTIGTSFLTEIPHAFQMSSGPKGSEGSADGVGGPSRRGSSVVINEEVLEELLRKNHALQEADNPVPTTLGKLLVHILETFVEQQQDIVVDAEMRLEELERGLDGGDDMRRELLKARTCPKIHLDLQRLLQAIANGEVVLPKVRARLLKSAPPFWAAPEDAALDSLMGRLSRTKENVGFLATRVAVLKAGLDQWQSEQINRKLYYLSILSMIFLPLNLITGFFGMNVGGLPWVPQTNVDVASEGGFVKVIILCLVIVLVMLVFFVAVPLHAAYNAWAQTDPPVLRWLHLQLESAFRYVGQKLDLDQERTE